VACSGILKEFQNHDYEQNKKPRIPAAKLAVKEPNSWFSSWCVKLKLIEFTEFVTLPLCLAVGGAPLSRLAVTSVGLERY
jgi:hypothetical protein